MQFQQNWFSKLKVNFWKIFHLAQWSKERKKEMKHIEWVRVVRKRMSGSWGVENKDKRDFQKCAQIMVLSKAREIFFKYHKINFVWALLFQFCQYTLHTHPSLTLNPYRRRLRRRWLWMTTLLWKGYSFGINVKYIYIFLPSLDSASSHATSHNAFTPFLLLYIFCDLQSNWFSRSFSSSSLLPYFIHCAWLRSVKNLKFFVLYASKEIIFIKWLKIPLYRISRHNADKKDWKYLFEEHLRQ